MPLWIDSLFPDTVLVLGPGQNLLRLAEARLQLPPRDIARAASGLPLWPADRRGAFSHWQGQSLCLLARGAAHHYGADVEGRADAETAGLLRAEAMGAGDLAKLRARALPDVETLIFSAKESFFKAAFPLVGRVFGFDALELAEPPQTDHLAFVLTQNLAPALRQGQRVRVRYVRLENAVVTWTRLSA
ncbi:4'-phosphopantetheinyl transferase family protein [Neogemmobacter tilapiae]|uniref:Enterobactin synthase component D n=1 Tax=Neogemmobacter tilapiae TaxID=875041 RepID=A0A918TXF6_9RHOB|nr:4'-phosphopantetheinyl transferase superfamily protein [Gemmobacter tilapiae]GHC65352.1 hypothetical protein GCM10007315_32420 [Gemmobacter tilapiae]